MSLREGPSVGQLASMDLELRSGQGCRVTGVDGSQYIDLFAGAGVCSLGHANQQFAAAIAEQLDAISVSRNPVAIRECARDALRSATAATLDHVVLLTTGAEAVDLALRVARATTGRRRFASFSGAFHGRMGLARSATDPIWGTRTVGEPDVDGETVRLPYPYSTVEMEEILASLRAEKGLSAIIVEPIQGTSGNRIPTAGFLIALRQCADDTGALLIVDEILSGTGRTGRFLAYPHDARPPDILLLGKGLGNGLPISALICSEELFCRARLGSISSTFGGNPLSAAAAHAVLTFVSACDFLSTVRGVGEVWLKELRDQLSGLAGVGKIDGQGLLIGIEIHDPVKRTPLDLLSQIHLVRELAAAGVLVGIGLSRLRLNPPLTIESVDAADATIRLAQGLSGYIHAR